MVTRYICRFVVFVWAVCSMRLANCCMVSLLVFVAGINVLMAWKYVVSVFAPVNVALMSGISVCGLV